MNEEEQKELEEQAAREAELATLSAITPEEYKVKVKKWMLLTDPYVLDLLPAHYIANKRPGDPVWLQIIGPSGGGKSELLVMFNVSDDYYPISSLTPNTLVSGFQAKKEVSLLPKLKYKIASLKDFTTIMNLNKEAQGEIFSQLREVYDGRLTKAFGNGKVVDWQGKVGMIAAATEVYDAFASRNAAMGERFMVYRLETGDRKETAMMAYQNSEHQKEMRWELQKAAYQLLKGIDLDFVPPELPNEVVESIIQISNLACLARSAVIRDMGFKKEVIFLPAPEMPTRLTQQMSKLCYGIATLYRGTNTAEHFNAIYKLGLDSIPKTNRLVLRQMTVKNNQSTADIARAIGYPTTTVHTFLDDIAIKGLAVRHKGSDTEEGGTGDRWELEQEYRNIFTKFDAIAQTVEVTDEEAQAIAANFGGEVVA